MLNKSKKEKNPDLAKEKEDFEAKLLKLKKKRFKEEAIRKADEKKRLQAEKDARDYKHLFTVESDQMITNADLVGTQDTSAAVNFEEDFM